MLSTQNITTERTHLAETLKLILKEKAMTDKAVRDLEKAYQEGLKKVSEESKSDDAVDLLKDLNKMMKEKDYVFKKRENDRLANQCNVPYFARLDFKPQKYKEPMVIYIGKYAFIPKDLSYRISDWRSPVASMYYNYTNPEPKAFYEFFVPEKYRPWIKQYKKIEGELLLRRNIEIENGELLAIYDNNLRIDLLSKELSEKSGGVLEDIVKTIQQEQDQIIRSDPFKVCVVQGTAGSGKTTIAIHRLAFLFYTYPDYLNENNTLLLSSSKVLVNYVSKVLPELEIYSLKRDTLISYTKEIFKENGYQYDSSIIVPLKSSKTGYINSKEFVDKIVSYVSNEKEKILKEIKILSNTHPNLNIERYLTRMSKTAPYELIDVLLTEFNEYMNDLTTEKRSGNITVERTIDDLKFVINKLQQKVKKYDPIEEYKKFLSSEGMESSGFNEDKIDIDNFCGIYYLANKIKGIKPINKEFKHVVIDEAQDLGLLQFLAINTFSINNGFTILGDLNQSTISGGVIKSWEELEEIWTKEDINYFDIKVSYRTTKQIITLAGNILKKFKDFKYLPVPFSRDGQEPVLKEFRSREEIINEISANINELRMSGDHKAVGIIETDPTKLTETQKVFEENGIDVQIIDDKFENFDKTGIYLIPEELVKGLEFNSVYVIDPNDDIFPFDPHSAKRLFVCVTRAINRVAVYSVKNHKLLIN